MPSDLALKWGNSSRCNVERLDIQPMTATDLDFSPSMQQLGQNVLQAVECLILAIGLRMPLRLALIAPPFGWHRITEPTLLEYFH